MLEIKRAVDRTLQIILDRKNVPLADMENCLHGLIILLSKDADNILTSLSIKDSNLRKNLNVNIISVGNLFTERGLKVSKLLTNIKIILGDSSDSSPVVDDVKNQLLEACEQIAIARKSVSLFTKVAE